MQIARQSRIQLRWLMPTAISTFQETAAAQRLTAFPPPATKIEKRNYMLL